MQTQTQTQLTFWTLVTRAANNHNVIFFDPFDSKLFEEVVDECDR